MGCCGSRQVSIEDDEIVVGKLPKGAVFDTEADTTWKPPELHWTPPANSPPIVTFNLDLEPEEQPDEKKEPQPLPPAPAAEASAAPSPLKSAVEKFVGSVGESLHHTFVEGKNGDAPEIQKVWNSVTNKLKPKAVNRADEMKKRQEEEEEKTRKVQMELERLRQKQIKGFVDNHVEEKEVVQQREKEEQKVLKDKAEEIRLEEEWRQKKKEEEIMKQRKIDEENAKKREAEKAILKKKIDSGKKLNQYEQKLADQYFGAGGQDELLDGGSNEAARKRHPSMLSERPQSVRKLTESNIINVEAVKTVMTVLEKNQEEKTEQTRSLVTLDPILESLRKRDSEMKEFHMNMCQYFQQFEVKDPKKDAGSVELARCVAANDQLELIEMYGSALDDVFLIELAERLKDPNAPAMEKLQEIHIESNQFTGKGMAALFEAVSTMERVPSLTSIKLANQKAIDTAAELAALQMLKDNPRINRLTLDFRKPIDQAEASRLIARNGALAKREGRSSLSRSSLSAGYVNSSPAAKPKHVKDIFRQASPDHEDDDDDANDD